jgi:hypothetical protein
VKKTPTNHRKAWSPDDDAKLRKLAEHNTPTGLIAYQLGRTPEAIRSHASTIDVSLMPPNRSPYNRRQHA